MGAIPSMGLIAGEPVTIERVRVTYDDDAERREEVAREEVAALVEPLSASALDAEGRPGGARTSIRAHIPKSYTESLAGCRIVWRGHRYEVVGDPQPYGAAHVPGRYDRAAEAVRVDG